MALSIEALRERIKGLNNNRGNRNKNQWKPTDKHTIRLLPLADSPDEPFHTVYSHYVNGKYIYCRTTLGDDCEVCDYAEALRGWKDSEGNDKPEIQRKHDWEIFKKIQRGESHYFAMIERKKDEKTGAVTNDGPFWWKTSKTILEGVLSICANDDWNAMSVENGCDGVLDVLFNPKSALDLDVDFKQPGNKDKKGNDKKFPITEIEEKKRFTALSKDSDEVKKLLSEIPSFDETVKVMTADEVRKLWNEIVDGGGPVVESKSDGTEVAGGAADAGPDTNNAEKPVDGKASVGDAVSKLLAAKRG